jgi:hypothetical protein
MYKDADYDVDDDNKYDDVSDNVEDYVVDDYYYNVMSYKQTYLYIYNNSFYIYI